MHNLKPTVSVAITAYNAEKNITRLVKSILSQNIKTFVLKEVVVHSDTSNDSTVIFARSIKDKRLKVVDSKVRLGFADSLIKLVKKNQSDVLILLNDDIVVRDRNFLYKIIRTFQLSEKVGLVCCNAQPFESGSFIASAVRAGYKPYKKISEETRSGNNVFTVDGKVLCFSKVLCRNIQFPIDRSLMGNVDKFIYFSCINLNLQYKYVKNAVIYFKCPQTIQDFVNWQTRN